MALRRDAVLVTYPSASRWSDRIVRDATGIAAVMSVTVAYFYSADSLLNAVDSVPAIVAVLVAALLVPLMVLITLALEYPYGTVTAQRQERGSRRLRSSLGDRSHVFLGSLAGREGTDAATQLLAAVVAQPALSQQVVLTIPDTRVVPTYKGLGFSPEPELGHVRVLSRTP